MTLGKRLGLAAVLVSGLVACALVAPPVRKLPDGSYRIACNDRLSTCLGAFENICEWHGYDVISASERRRRTDLRDVPNETVTSEAQVRCKLGEPLFGSSPAPPADGGASPSSGTSPASPAPSPPAPQ
jgi:hypothetical protein